MTLAECQARDWLSYLHSTAMMLEAAAPQAAGQHWHAALAEVDEEVRERIANAARRMKWAQKLPASRRWGGTRSACGPSRACWGSGTS